MILTLQIQVGSIELAVNLVQSERHIHVHVHTQSNLWDIHIHCLTSTLSWFQQNQVTWLLQAMISSKCSSDNGCENGFRIHNVCCLCIDNSNNNKLNWRITKLCTVDKPQVFGTQDVFEFPLKLQERRVGGWNYALHLHQVVLLAPQCHKATDLRVEHPVANRTITARSFWLRDKVNFRKKSRT